jgi:hypothetical protein
MTRKLRAVAPDEVSVSKRKSVGQAAAGGDRRELLVAMRARVATAVEDPNTPARDLAALTRRLLEIAKEIEAIDSTDEEDEVSAAARTPDEPWDESAI